MLQILMLEDQVETKVMAAMHNLRAPKLAGQPEIITIHLNKAHKVTDLPEMKPTLHLPELRADLATLLLHQMAAVVVQPAVAVVVAVQDHLEQEEVN